MTLAIALELLCGVHMRDIEAELPTVVMGAEPDLLTDPKDYLIAWLAVRKHVLAERGEAATEAEMAEGFRDADGFKFSRGSRGGVPVMMITAPDQRSAL